MIARVATPIDEIVERYPSQFVLVDSCRFDDAGKLTHGRILEQSADSDPVYQSLREHPNSVIVYTGPDVHEVEGAFLAVGS